MASNTKRVKIRRTIKKASAGKDRKNSERNLGVVAKNLPLDKPNANELKQKKHKK
jgi:hypothetical protein